MKTRMRGKVLYSGKYGMQNVVLQDLTSLDVPCSQLRMQNERLDPVCSFLKRSLNPVNPSSNATPRLTSITVSTPAMPADSNAL